MATTENERLELYELAKHEVGDRFAELMMRSLPPEPDDLVRTADLESTRHALQADIAAVRTDLGAEIAEVRSRIDVMGAELRVEMRDLTSAQTHTMMLGLVGSITALTITELVIDAFG